MYVSLYCYSTTYLDFSLQIVYVIDSGKVKESQYEVEAGLFRLVEIWTTKAAARQRRGRAGRTQPGTCYKLYTRRREVSLANFPVPEILRVPLENVLLTIKVIRESEDPKVRNITGIWAITLLMPDLV